MKHKIHIFICFCVLISSFAGCGQTASPNAKNPVTLTMWHTYVEQMKVGMEELVDEFNTTVGAQKGITVNITAISNASVLNEKLLMAANGDPGAPELPDMAVAYPKVAVVLAEKNLLMDFGSQFSEEELSRYVPHFLTEGRLFDDKLYLLPIAKSTEVLYVNKTIFDRFAKATGVTMEQLSTFEGIIDAANRYYQWTDDKTPEIPHDGKAFYYPDSLFNFSMVGCRQLGSDLITDGKLLNLSDPVFRRIWDCYYPSAVKGEVAIFDDYGNYLAKTGDIVCTTSTSAGAIYYPDSVTYADNTKEDVEFSVLSYPVFEGGEKVALQRGGGMCVMKSAVEKEAAAAVFLKWLTEPAQNLRFTASTGYLPVTQGAFDTILTSGTESIDNPNIKKALDTAVAMQKDYTFYSPPVFDGLDELQKVYASKLLDTTEKSKQQYIALLESNDESAAYRSASAGVFETFIQEAN